MTDIVSIEIRPDPTRLIVRLKELNQQSLDKIHFRLVEGANRLRNNLINRMRRTPKTGRRYKRGKKWHIASSPGNAPAVDRGGLIRNIIMNEGWDFVQVKADTPYAMALEKGATYKDGRTMLPRPFFEPAVEAETPRIERKILNDLERMKL